MQAWLRVQSAALPERSTSCSKEVQTDGRLKVRSLKKKKNAHVQNPWLYFLCGANITMKNNRTARSITEVIFIVYSLQMTFSKILKQLVLLRSSQILSH